MRRHAFLYPALIWATFVGWLPPSARADDDLQPIFPIAVQYHGGRLLQSVRVETLFWGDWWNHSDSQQDEQRAYMNAFFADLFLDGRFMSNLAQYSARRQPIHNGKFDKTYTEPQGITAAAGTHASRDEVEALLKHEIGQHNLPAPDDNTLYYVFLPANVTLAAGDTRRGLHKSFSSGVGQPEVVYAVILYQADPQPEVESHNPHLTTSTVSHELAEAVTNPAGHGWYYLSDFEEIGDIPNNLYDYGWITPEEHWSALDGSSGRRYLVEQVWSNRDKRPVAFK